MERPNKIRCNLCGDKIEKRYRSPYFCWECDRARIKRINKQLGSMVSGDIAATEQEGEI